ncbi:MAG TPA: serine hydrolase domain-containing protein [Thermomicrobiales bacterium]|nr:serine hydrolase domain-containing protein [Thermomicrobiales bacterium]
MDEAWRIVTDGVEKGAYAGAVALVTRRGETRLCRAAGWAVREPDRIPMATDTIFDLASLTKVVATLPSILRLVDQHALTLDDPVGTALPEFGTAGWKREVTIRRLLSHSAGLPAWLPLYLDQTGSAAYLDAISRVEPVAAPGERVVYSDLGFILLGEVVRRLTGLDVARFAAREIFATLGLRDNGYTPDPSLRPRIAATERGNETEIGMCGDRAPAFPRWRREVIWGEVNDGNCFYGLSGVSGHAGLFGTAADLARYGQLWLHGGTWEGRRIFGEELAIEATRAQAPGRGLGWRVGSPTSAADQNDPGVPLGAAAYGHTGFTGTSLWIDPSRELVAVLLTNRLYPTARSEIDAIRPAFHRAVATAIDESSKQG